MVDEEYRDDVLKMIEGQQTLSRVDRRRDGRGHDARGRRGGDVAGVRVAEDTYEWVGTTCGLDRGRTWRRAAGVGDEPLVEPASHGDVSVIVDQSPTVSDVGALGFLAARADVDLLAVTMPATGEADCVARGGDHPGGARRCRPQRRADRLRRRAARRDERMAGRTWREAADALAGVVAPGVDEHRVLRRRVGADREWPRPSAPVTIVALGPLTNIAAVLETDPSLADRIERIVVMGGAVSVPGNVEPDLAGRVEPLRRSGRRAGRDRVGRADRRSCPLDATDQVPLTSDYVAGVAVDRQRPGRRRGRRARQRCTSLDYLFMWDELAAVLTVQPEVATWSERSIVVEDDGSTVESPDGTPVQVAVGADAPSVWSLMLAAFDESGS